MLEDLDVVLRPLPTSYLADEDEDLDEALDTIGTECETGIEEDLLDKLWTGILPSDTYVKVIIPRKEVGLAT